MLYSINYDLKGPKADYEPLLSSIKALGVWWHYLDSMWLVVSQDDVRTLYSRLSPNLRKGDCLIILNVTDSAYYGILPRDAWPWIESRQQEERGRHV